MQQLITSILFLSCLSCTGQTIQEYSRFIEESEGRRNVPYMDTRGNLTVGVGHRIIGDYKNYYSNQEVDELLEQDTIRAISIAERLFINFNEHPAAVKKILVSLSFNLGQGGLSKFRRFRSAINARNYNNAADELVDSLWYGQVGNRGVKYTNILRSLQN